MTTRCHAVTLCAVDPYRPQDPVQPGGPPFPGQASGPPYPGLPPDEGPARFYGPPPYLAPPRQTMSAVVILAIAFGAQAALCIVGGVLSSVAVNPAPEPAATVTRAAAPATPKPTRTSSRAPAMAAVPNLVGKNAAVAEAELEKLGFTNIKLGSVDKQDTVVILPENWKVAEQSHPPGRTIPTDTLVVLGCTKRR